MITIEIPEIKFKKDIPSEIDEMSNEQFQRYVDLALMYAHGQINEDLFRNELVSFFLQIKSSVKYFRMSPEERIHVDSNLFRLGELMSSFIEVSSNDGETIRSLKLRTVRNFVPRIGNLIGPEDAFGNLTLCEYRVAREYFREYSENGDVSALDKMIAVLYRPKKMLSYFIKFKNSFSGDFRIAYTSKSNPLKLEARARRISKVPFPIKYCVYVYFAGCEDYIKEGKPVIDGKQIDFGELYKESDGDDGSSIGMIGLLFSIAESGVFGTVEQTDQQNIWDIMVRLYQVVMQIKSLTKKNKSDDKGS